MERLLPVRRNEISMHTAHKILQGPALYRLFRFEKTLWKLPKCKWDRMNLDWCSSLDIEADVACAGWRRRLKIWEQLELPAAGIARRLGLLGATLPFLSIEQVFSGTANS